jgi:outer membrane autotransporter protein
LPNLRPEVPLDLAIPAIAGRYGLALLGSYSERADARTAGDLTGSGNNAYWTRAFGETGSWGSSGGTASAQLQRFDKYGPSYDFGLAGVEVGVDLVKNETDRGARDVAGVFVGGGSANASVNGVYGGDAGNATLNAYSLGAYWTRLAPTGWYIDTVVQGTFYGQANTASTANQSLMTNGWGLISSLEVGYPIALGSKWNIEPQAQAIYQHLAIAGSADSFGQVTYGATDTGYGRVGVRLSRAWQLANGHQLSAWIETNLWQAVGDENRATFSDLQGSDPASFSSGSGGPSAESGVGIMAQLAQNVSLTGAFQYAKHLDSESGESFGGSANINVSW